MPTEFGIKTAPSIYYAARSRPPSRREIDDEKLRTEIQRVYDENYRVYGAKKMCVSSTERASRWAAVGLSGSCASSVS